MWFGLLTLFTALAIAGVAAWFSIAGLMIFFGGMPLSIAIMAGVLEVGKLLTASWLYRYWNETSFALKTYLSSAVIVLMLITSAGIYGYLAKASSDVSSDGAIAFAEVDRIDGQIAREENKIDILEDRILSVGGSVDVSESIKQQETIRDGAWDRVQGDIDFANGQIVSLRAELTTLNEAVNDLRNKGVEVVVLDEGGIFQGNETEKIDYVAQANQLFEQQKPQRDQIQADIKLQQDNIDNYRAQAQTTIDDANAEINRLRNNSQSQQDDNLIKIDDFNNQIDGIYDVIAVLKDEKFEAESKVRDIEREIGPIKYVAELLYGSSEQDVMDQAIRIFILLFVFVFDPLAVMLLIAANQTLLRYGINLESTGPKDPDPGDWDMLPDPEELEEFKKMQKENASAAEDAAVAMAESAAEKKRVNELKKALSLLETKYAKTLKALEDKPKEVIVEKEVEVVIEKEVEVPVEVIKEVVVEREVPIHVEIEKVVEKEKIVEKPVEVEKIVEVVKEVEVPGPERVVVRTDNTKIDKLTNTNNRLKNRITDLEKEVNKQPEIIEKEVPVEIEKPASGDLKEAARLMAQSEFNKEDLTEKQIFDMLQKTSEEDVKKKIGFWAMPLPKSDTDNKDTNKRYIGKK
tara:strand:- start:148 stop:2046 length:1899 start_codon:yes stop_codon:yes gene_type:complete